MFFYVKCDIIIFVIGNTQNFIRGVKKMKKIFIGRVNVAESVESLKGYTCITFDGKRKKINGSNAVIQRELKLPWGMNSVYLVETKRNVFLVRNYQLTTIFGGPYYLIYAEEAPEVGKTIITPKRQNLFSDDIMSIESTGIVLSADLLTNNIFCARTQQSYYIVVVK